MSHACHRFWICDKTLTFYLVLTRCTIFFPPATRKHIWTSKSAPYTQELFHFWLGNVLRATTACTFSTCCAFNVLTWKCASRHNGVQLFISHLASWLRTRRFGEPICRPSRATNHWKNSNFFPSLLWFSLLCSSLLSDSAHLCFSSVHIVGSFTSKFPSVMNLLFNIFDAPFTTSKK